MVQYNIHATNKAKKKQKSKFLDNSKFLGNSNNDAYWKYSCEQRFSHTTKYIKKLCPFNYEKISRNQLAKD